jgi:hypothetical protein
MGSSGKKNGTGNFMDDIIDGANAIISLTGYDPSDGTFGNVGIPAALDEGIGEISGRNLAREETFKADKRILEEKALREQEAKDQLKRAEQEDLQLSFAAAGARKDTNIARSRQNLRFTAGNSDEKDFLGI